MGKPAEERRESSPGRLSHSRRISSTAAATLPPAPHSRPRTPRLRAVPAVRSPPRTQGSLPAAATPPSPTPPGGPAARAPRPRVSPAAAKEFGSSKWPPRRSPNSERPSKGRVGRAGRRGGRSTRRSGAGGGGERPRRGEGRPAAGRPGRRRRGERGGKGRRAAAPRRRVRTRSPGAAHGPARRGEEVEAARRMAFGAGEGKRRPERRVRSGRVRLPPRRARPAPPLGAQPDSPSRGLSRYQECRRCWKREAICRRRPLLPARRVSGGWRRWGLRDAFRGLPPPGARLAAPRRRPGSSAS